MFITFEGLDCSGKTIQAKKLVDYLNSDLNNQQEVILTKQLGGCELTEHLRNMVLYEKNISDVSKFLLINSDRSIHVETIIEPALNENKIVVCDRYADSTFAYQYFGAQLQSKIDSSKILNIINLGTHGILPDLTFYIDITPEECLTRLKNSGRNLDLFEQKQIGFYKRVYLGYEQLVNSNSSRIVKLKGSLSIDQLHNIIVRTYNIKKDYLQGKRIEDKEGNIKQTVKDKYDPYATNLNKEYLSKKNLYLN